MLLADKNTPAVDLRIWIADLTHTQQTVAADVMPTAIGCIAAYAEMALQLPAPIRIFKYPEKLAAALEQDGFPDVLAFSNYVWNHTLGAEFARVVKQRSPKTVIVFGGPNYPVHAGEREAFLRASPQIDFYIIKEGEVAFSGLMRALQEENRSLDAVKLRDLPSVHSIDAQGQARLAAEAPRLNDLTEIPSPYLDGRMDEFFDGILVPIVHTNRGCPFACTFCVEGVSYYNKIYRSSQEKITAELDYIGSKMAEVRAKGGRNDLFIADSNFGMYKDDLETCRQLAQTRKLYGWPQYINVATGKNQKERVLEASRLIDGALRLSGSVQSLDPNVLKNIKRANISADGLLDLALKAAEVGANSYSEIILGLPGDSLESHLKTIQSVMDAGFNFILLYQLMLLPGTELASDESKQQWAMDLRYRVLPRCYGRYSLLGHELPIAEIEEVCVGNNTLDFDQYLHCRRMHLVVSIFHNDGIFGTFLKILRRLNVSVYRWIELLTQAEFPGQLHNVFQSFEDSTRSELWSDRDGLAAFIQQDGVVERFVNGELGNNLLFVHKSRAISNCGQDLASIARKTAEICLAEHGKDDPEILAMLDDSIRYHMARMTNLFEYLDESHDDTFWYDIRQLDADREAGDLASYKLSHPVVWRFELDEQQKNLINQQIGLFGATPVGIGRILSKVYVRRLFRHATDAGGAVASGATKRDFMISGLQN